MSFSEQVYDENQEFWENSNRYSWSNKEPNFLKELSVVKLPDNYVKEDWDWLSTDEPQ